MDFRLSPEQEMLRDGARRFVADHLNLETRAGDRPSHWAGMAELGWLMLPVPQDCDGLGGGIDDILILAEEMGRGLALEPFLEAALLPAMILDGAGTPKQRQALLPSLATGEIRYAVALHEPRRGFALTPQDMALQPDAGGYRLTGAKVGVEEAASADRLLVSALHEGRAMIAVVDIRAEGVTRIDYPSIDGRSLADIRIDNVLVGKDDLLVATGDGIQATIDRAVDHVVVGQCADMLGGMDRAIEMTADYLKIRQQFDQPLAGFQALQHGVADMFIEANDARSILYRAASMIDAPSAERAKAVSACKVKVMDIARMVIGTAVHYHGGIGVTTEYGVGHYLRRALLLDQRFGNGAWHFERMIAVT